MAEELKCKYTLSSLAVPGCVLRLINLVPLMYIFFLLSPSILNLLHICEVLFEIKTAL